MRSLYMKISTKLLIHVDLCPIIFDKMTKRGNNAKQNKFGTIHLTTFTNTMNQALGDFWQIWSLPVVILLHYMD